MELFDSRRLTGPNLIWDHAGAIADIGLAADESAEDLVAAWLPAARELLDRVGWSKEQATARQFEGGVSLVISAPMDALYSAVELIEASWEAVSRALQTGEPPLALAAIAGNLAQSIVDEANPPLLALKNAAEEHGVTFLSDDDFASVGVGDGSLTWKVDALPSPGDIAWDDVHDIPIALVTGTNGKTTTVRLLSMMASEAGLVTGSTSTDGISIDSRLVDPGDWSGPGGARTVCRRPEVEIAILEAARGGLLRRGLGIRRADASAVTNVAEDHMGEFGVQSLAELTDVKLIVARAVSAPGRVVLNADDANLRGRVEALRREGAWNTPVTWVSLNPSDRFVRSELEAGEFTALLEDGILVLRRGADDVAETVLPQHEIPIAHGGSARHNVYNALTAIGLADALGLPMEAVRRGLRRFGTAAADNSGRGSLFDIGGIRLIVDFAHNPHGIGAMAEMALAMDADRRLVILGQAGDRSDAAIRDLTRAAWSMRPALIVIKELGKYLRGRPAGEIPALIRDELVALGAPDDIIAEADTELSAVRVALEAARPGDLVLLPIQEHLNEVVRLIETLQASGWQPGEPLQG